jgi:hypothetical protein
MNTQQIEGEIVSALQAITKPFPKGPTEWTKAVLLAIGTIGDKLDYAVCGLGEHFEPEWLYDLCWCSNSPDNQKLLNVTLVLESEWRMKHEEIKRDFEKLLIAKAKFKVFVFQAKGQNVAKRFKELEQGIHTYQDGSLGEVYLLACYDDYFGAGEIKKVEGVYDHALNKIIYKSMNLASFSY